MRNRRQQMGSKCLGKNLAPLMLPRRAVRDLEAVGTAARGLPGFERALLERLDDLGAEVPGLLTKFGVHPPELIAGP
jgi:hypothetical protein